jgi:hypothetical protein
LIAGSWYCEIPASFQTANSIFKVPPKDVVQKPMNVLLIDLYRHIVDAETAYFCSANFMEEIAVTAANPNEAGRHVGEYELK